MPRHIWRDDQAEMTQNSPSRASIYPRFGLTARNTLKHVEGARLSALSWRIWYAEAKEMNSAVIFDVLSTVCVVHLCVSAQCSPDARHQLSRNFFVGTRMVEECLVVSRREAVTHKLRSTGLEWSSVRNGESDTAANSRCTASTTCQQ